jgi:arabinan endo-1,5-alpha-L-arabinosidase
MRKILGIFSLIWLFPLCLLAQNNQTIVHDPVAIQVDSAYYIFNTGVGIANLKSSDLINWQYLGPVFPSSPEWAKTEVPKFDGNIWAPDISFHNGKYYLYYSISSFASNRSCIGVATNATLDRENPDYKWEDHGKLIESVPGRDNWNAIDPNLIFDENGKPWLAFGSFWGGLKIVKLNNDLLSVAQPEEWNTIASRERDFTLDETDPGNAAIEAPFIFRKGDYYFLFVSFDLCCRGEHSNYNVRVGRSKSVSGPYIDKSGVALLQGGGTLLLAGDEKFYGVGHNSVYNFNGSDYFFCHGYLKKEKGIPILITQKLVWGNDGWPNIIR